MHSNGFVCQTCGPAGDSTFDACMLSVFMQLFVSNSILISISFLDFPCIMNLAGHLTANFSKTLPTSQAADIVTLQHPIHFNKSLRREFIENMKRERRRRELTPVLSDIARLWEFLGRTRLRKRVKMADIIRFPFSVAFAWRLS